MDVWKQPFHQLAERAVDFFPKLVTALVIFVVGLYLAALAGRSVHRVLVAQKFDPELSILFRRMVRVSIMVMATIVALEQVSFDLTAFVAGVDIVGFTIGFALQDVSKNFVAGTLLLLQQPFEIGDAIEVAGHAGVVTGINLWTTEFRTFEGLVVLIPNGQVFTKPILKFGRRYHRRLQLTLEVNTADAAQVQRLLRERLVSIEGVRDDEPSPKLLLSAISEGGCKLVAYFWIDFAKTDLVSVQNDVCQAVQSVFAAEGIAVKTIAIAAPAPDVVGGSGRAI
ncbi:MAG: mechanosensitive ion channel domain-containing protein [Polyangiaceae bacterium]